MTFSILGIFSVLLSLFLGGVSAACAVVGFNLFTEPRVSPGFQFGVLLVVCAVVTVALWLAPIVWLALAVTVLGFLGVVLQAPDAPPPG